MNKTFKFEFTSLELALLQMALKNEIEHKRLLLSETFEGHKDFQNWPYEHKKLQEWLQTTIDDQKKLLDRLQKGL